MGNKIKLAIFTAKNILTSTGSTNTVVNLLNNLDSDKYEIALITIDGFISPQMIQPQEKLLTDPSYIPFSEIEKNKKILHIYKLENLTLTELKNLAQFAIIAIYNTFGEDGKLIGLLDTVGIPYLSPSLKTSALCFDKEMTKVLLKGSGIMVAKGRAFHKNKFELNAFIKQINHEFVYPVIVKTTSSGASRGIMKVEDQNKLAEAALNAFNYCDEFIVEEFLIGQEFSIGVYGHYLDPKALPVVEIKTSNSFFDFEAKYSPGKSSEICPADITDDLTKQIQDLAERTYTAVKADSHARIDVIYSRNELFVLEVNTFPGLTLNSIFPKELKAAGLSLSKFLDDCISKKIYTS